jgi:hypothetical protein
MSVTEIADNVRVKTFSLSEFRSKYSSLLNDVCETGERIQVTRYGRPLAEIRRPGLSAEERARRDASDLELINRYAGKLNAEAKDALEFQALGYFERRKGNVRKQKSRKR